MYKRLLTIQDISCVGQCSLTVALPVISACGIETAVLPSAVLSTHTAGFSGYTFTDLTEDMPAISKHWEKENLKFDAIYTGYLGSAKQIEYVKNIFKVNGKDGCLKIVDPAMADNGNLYPGFDMAFVEEMKSLCAEADYVLPNLTEACFLTGTEYKTEYDKEYIDSIIEKLKALGFLNMDNSPRQQYINDGSFITIVKYINEHVGNKTVTLVTSSGLIKLAQKLGVEVDFSVAPDGQEAL
jgi:pyridoxine kinase